MPGDPHTAREPSTGRVVLGVGASRGCPPEELSALADDALAEAGVGRDAVYAVASATVKADEPAILDLAAALGVPARYLDATDLAAVDVPTPSVVVASHVGTPSVAEAAALLVAREIGPAGLLLVHKRRSAHATCAVAVTIGTGGETVPVGPTTAPAEPTSGPAATARSSGAPARSLGAPDPIAAVATPPADPTPATAEVPSP